VSLTLPKLKIYVEIKDSKNQILNETNNMKNENAVSPVIGTILMVAITVILSAVIAGLVFGMPGNIHKTRLVTASATQNGDDINIVYQGGIDDGPLMYIMINTPDNDVTGGDCISVTDPWYTMSSTGGTTNDPSTLLSSSTVPAVPAKPNVGAIYTFDGCGSGGRNHVIIVGFFGEGTQQVILDTYV